MAWLAYGPITWHDFLRQLAKDGVTVVPGAFTDSLGRKGDALRGVVNGQPRIMPHPRNFTPPAAALEEVDPEIVSALVAFFNLEPTSYAMNILPMPGAPTEIQVPVIAPPRG